jgi:hypothetical protein
MLLFILEIFKNPDQTAGHHGLHLIVEMQLPHLLRLVPLVVPVTAKKETENYNPAFVTPIYVLYTGLFKRCGYRIFHVKCRSLNLPNLNDKVKVLKRRLFP